MLGTAETVEAVVAALRLRRASAPVVVDPVMVAESGAVLLDDEAREALIERLLPLATVVTPNIPEARALTGLAEEATQEELARAVVAPRARSGRRHRRPQRGAGRPLLRRRAVVEIPGERHPDGAAHGSGCTHSSALAAFLARGAEPLEAARKRPRGRLRGGRRRPARDRLGPGPGRRLRSDRQALRRDADSTGSSRFRAMSTNGATRPSFPVPARRPSSTAPTAPTRAPT